MHRNLLKIIHNTLNKRAIIFQYHEFPKTLSSLNKPNPTDQEIRSDYTLMSSHFNHPIYQNIIPTYEEMSTNQYMAWINCHIKNTNLIK